MANLVYMNEATPILWQDASADHVMTLNNLGTLTLPTGRQGAIHDFGVAARSKWFAWRAWFQSATTPVVGEVARVYVKTSNTLAIPDNSDGTGDHAVVVDKLLNLLQIGTIKVDEAATGVKFVKSGLIWLPHRYFMPIIWNATADLFVATNNLSGFQLTPVPDEIQ